MKASHPKDYHLRINHAVGFCGCDMVVRQHCHIINSSFLHHRPYLESYQAASCGCTQMSVILKLKFNLRAPGVLLVLPVQKSIYINKIN